MASNNHKSSNPNQPRRKRNKKPVKRYSEEYSNRPNPYTGYSADGNYHPDAKKHPIGDASAVKAAKEAEEAQRAALNAAMADAVWPPASAGYVPPTVTIPAPNWANTDRIVNQQRSESAPVETAAQTAPRTGTEPSGVEPSEETSREDEAPAAAPAAPQRRRTGSHRRKNADREAAQKAKTAKMEAKKAALDMIAKGVAAHSVSEQMIDDITSMTDAIESMAKAEKASSAASANTERAGSVNWDEFYDAAFPPREKEAAKRGRKKSKNVKQRVDFGEDAYADQTMPVKPVVLGDDEPLPYDKITAENAREAEELLASAAESAEVTQEAPDVSPVSVEVPVEAVQEEPVPDADDTLSVSLPDLSEPFDAALDAAAQAVETAEAVSIGEILQAVEREKQEAAAKAEVIRQSTEFTFDALSFDSHSSSEGWHEIKPPAADEADGSSVPAEDDSVSLLSQRLLESYMELENQTQEDESAAGETAENDGEPLEEDIPVVDLNAFLRQTQPQTEESAEAPSEPEAAAEPEITVEVESEAAATAAEPQDTAQEEPVPVEIDFSDIEDAVFAETELPASETLYEDAAPAAESEPSVSQEDAVQEKLEKLVEAAELAEVLRQESEDTLPPSEQAAYGGDIFSVDLHADDLPIVSEVTKLPDAEEEVILEYRPREKKPDEKVFESVLIVDDNQQLLDPDVCADQDDTLFLHSREPSENPTAVFKLPDGPIVLPTDVDDADFQEQWLDNEEDGDEMASRTKRARRRISAFIGAMAIVVALMILGGVLKTVITGFTNLGGTGEKKAEYTQFIAPVVLNDPAPFESLEKADNQMLLESAIWRALDEIAKTEGYEYTYDATNKIVLSADIVEQAGRDLFGDNVKLNMNVLSESDGSAIYYYDSIDNSFHIFTGGITGPSANITKIAQKSDHVSLVVGYSSQSEMTLTSSDENPECYKYMEYVLGLNPDGSYYIQSIRNYVEE